MCVCQLVPGDGTQAAAQSARRLASKQATSHNAPPAADSKASCHRLRVLVFDAAAPAIAAQQVPQRPGGRTGHRHNHNPHA
jgi:hypothetical protein